MPQTMKIANVTILLVLTGMLAGCTGANDPAAEARAGARGARANNAPIAVTSTYLAAALADLLGERTALLPLAAPGMCPGHFDLRPSQVRQLRQCGLLVRFDFQQSLDSRLSDHATDPPEIVSVRLPGGMCEPASYQAACEQLAVALVRLGRLGQTEADARLAAIADRIEQLSTWSVTRIEQAGLAAAPVLCSGHQAGFCRFLGLNAVATFSAADTAQPSQIDRAVKQGQQQAVRLIVANLPEGRQLADALADRLGATVVVFGNSPEGDATDAFDQLVRRNVEALIRARS